MSHAILHGKPFESQLYLDRVLSEVVASRGVSASPQARAGVSLPQLMYYCLKTYPDDVFMINGATGEKITNGQILQQAIPLARALISKGVKGKTVLMTMDNHKPMAVTYFALMFAGTLPFFAPSILTSFEIVHFLKLFEPCMIFCDEAHLKTIKAALASVPGMEAEIMVADRDPLPEQNDVDFVIPDVDPKSPSMILPTSGSTGMPKGCLLTHQGFISQIPMIWVRYSRFPRPIKLGLLLGTCSSISFNVSVVSCLLCRVTLLVTQNKFSLDHLMELMLTYRPQSLGLTPSITQALLPALTPEVLSSLEVFALNGAPSTVELRTALKDKLNKSAAVYNFYGMTELHGTVTSPHDADALGSANHVSNIFDFKLVNESGEEVGLREHGELYVRGPAVCKGYYRNQSEFEDSCADGWLRTGDVFYMDEKKRLLFMERRKFNFEAMGQRVSPEEIEQVINSVPGVLSSVVCQTASGPTAAVVAAKNVTREVIIEKVTDNLSKHKWLNGGIAFVPALPHSHTGKIHRGQSHQLLQQLIRAGECFQSWRTIIDLNKFR